MTRLAHAWRGMAPEQRLAAAAAIGLLVTMFLPWYGLQSLNPRTRAIYSHDISAFGDVSFVEAAIFLVAVGVGVLLFARAEGREFQLPGGDGTVVLVAGAWAAVLIFYRVFSRPAGNGYPVGIQWGFFLAFVAAGTLAFAGWRMRAGERPGPPLSRGRRERAGAAAPPAPVNVPATGPPRDHAPTPVPSGREARGEDPTEARRPAPQPAAAPRARAPRTHDAPTEPLDAPEQLSFEDPPTRPG